MTQPPLPSWATPKPKGGVPAPGSTLDRQYETFIGPRWETYRQKFGPFFEEPRFQPTWNWSAALFSPIWFVYRKLYLPFVFFLLAPWITIGMLWQGEQPTPADLAADPQLLQNYQLVTIGVQLSAMVLAGGTANYLLFRRARAAIALAEQRSPDMDTLELILTRLGSVNWIGVAVILVMLLVAGMVRSLNGAP